MGSNTYWLLLQSFHRPTAQTGVSVCALDETRQEGDTQSYRQSSKISRTLYIYIYIYIVGNKRVDHSDVVGASPVGAAPITSSFSTLAPGLNGLDKGNC